MFPFLLAILFDFSFKELERFSFAVQLYLFSLVSSFKDGLFKVFQFCIASSLALSACFPVCFGTAKVRIFFDFCKKFFLFFLRPFQLSFFFASYLLFSFLAALRYPVAFCNSLRFGIAKVRIFFHSRKKYFAFFSRLFTPSYFLSLPSFQYSKAALRCFRFFPPFPFGIAKVRLFSVSAKKIYPFLKP